MSLQQDCRTSNHRYCLLSSLSLEVVKCIEFPAEKPGAEIPNSVVLCTKYYSILTGQNSIEQWELFIDFNLRCLKNRLAQKCTLFSVTRTNKIAII